MRACRLRQEKNIMKIDRQLVLEKYDNHCAYCGCEITLKTMQVDHVLSKHNGGTDTLDNFMPACISCNHYKRAGGVECLRQLLLDMHRKLRNIYIFKVSEKYGMIQWNEWGGKFYFEKTRKERYD